MFGIHSLGVHFGRQFEHAFKRPVIDLHGQHLHRLGLVAVRLRRQARSPDGQAAGRGQHLDGGLVHSRHVHADDEAVAAAVAVDGRPPAVGGAEVCEVHVCELAGYVAQLAFQTFQVAKRIFHRVPIQSSAFMQPWEILNPEPGQARLHNFTPGAQNDQ